MKVLFLFALAGYTSKLYSTINYILLLFPFNGMPQK